MDPLAQQIQEQLERTLYHPYSMQSLSKQFGLSAAALNERFKKTYGMTIPAYIRNRRLEQAAIFLAKDTMPVTRIAIKIGYANPSKFSQAFRKKFGVSPSEYRQRLFIKDHAE